MNLGSLIVKIGADTVQFTQGVDLAKTQLRGLDDQVRGGASTFVKYAAAAAAAAAVLGGKFVADSISAIEAQADLATKLDTTSASMATLARAGALNGVEMGQISAASRMLALNLSKAASEGAGPAADALARLNLTASQLQALPLDQRISAINTAIGEFIPAAQQASVAADLFGSKNALAMSQLDSAVIAEAARQTAVFGLNLSELDASKVGAAADAMGVFGMAISGAGQQLAIQFAPILTAISDDFLDASEKAGGFGTMAEEAFAGAVEAAAFFADAFAGVGRVFDLTADGIIVLITGVIEHLSLMVADTLEGVDKMAQALGSDMFAGAAEASRAFQTELAGVIDQAQAHMSETLNKPLPGDALRQYVADAKAAADEAALVATTATPGGADPAAGPTEADTKKAEAEQAEFEARLARIQEQNMTIQELERQHQQAMIDVGRAFDEGKIATVEENNAIMEQLAADHAAKLSTIQNKAALEQAKQEAQKLAERKQANQTFFSNLSTLMNTESRKAFEIGKAAATANAVIKGIESAVSAFSAGMSVGGPAAPAVAAAYMAASLAATGAQISAIQSQSFGGGGSGGGGGAGAASATQAVNAASTPISSPQQGGGTYSIAGLNPSEMFSGGQVRALMSRMNEEKRDGTKLEFV